MEITLILDNNDLDILYRAKVIQDKTDVNLITRNMQYLLECKIEELDNFDKE